MVKKALITGIGGSGPSYLAEYLTTIPNLEVSGIYKKTFFFFFDYFLIRRFY